MDHTPDEPVGLNVTTHGQASGLESPVQFALVGELDIASASEFDRQLSEALAAGRAVELDLSGLTFIDSTGLGVLIRRAVTAANDDVSLTIRRTELAPQVRRLIDLTDTAKTLWP